jgi:holo-[acyl-carrier protein] synthase
MIFAIGVDIVKVERIDRANKRNPFFSRLILSQKEFQIFAERHFSPSFLAGRFSAKEAILKSIGIPLGCGKKLSQIEILPSRSERPNVILKGEVLKHFNSNNLTKIHISISHEKEFAIGFAVAEK